MKLGIEKVLYPNSGHMGEGSRGEYLPSITGLLTSPYDSWNVDILRSEEDIGSQHKFEPSATESSCISGEEVSELDDESEEDRDADGSDTEGVAPRLQSSPCPHEERRSSERYFPRSHHSSSGRKTKRKHRKKHFKDSNSRVQSSEEEEREISSTSVFASLLSRDEPPATFDPTPPESSQSFSALLSSEEPIPSYRSSWGGERQEALHDNWQRTAPHYNREDVDNSMKSVNWYRDEDIDLDSYRKSKFGDPSLIGDPLDDVGSRVRGHSAVKLLTKNVNGLKKKIKKFEEEFEKSFGYRPSHADKMKHKDIKKYMADLSKAKKELKQMKEDVPEKKVRSYQKPFPISLLRCQESTNVSSVTQTSSSPTLPNKVTKETYRQVEERLSVKRTEAGRPTKVADLSLDQLKEEKTDIQKALLFYESVHGRPNTREDKELVRPLYDRYRLVKRSVNKLITRPKENIAELPPIIEHVVMDFTLASPQHRGSLKEEDDSEEEESAISALPLNPDPHPEVVPTSTPELNLGDLHALPIHELKERKKEAREEKRRLRHSLPRIRGKIREGNGKENAEGRPRTHGEKLQRI
ncbi:Protein FAM13A [Armadillidium vulgare]|nr:Protein FAM13A [Armadillidium vulgare]